MNQHTGGRWPLAAHEVAAELWEEGLTASQISKRLFETLGLQVSRSSVIGRMRRVGVPHGEREAVAKVEPKPAPAPAPVKPAPPREPRVAQPEWRPTPRPVQPLAPRPAGGIRLVDSREGQCRFIAGQPTADAVCCGAGTPPGSSWCPSHRRLVFAQPREPRRTPA